MRTQLEKRYRLFWTNSKYGVCIGKNTGRQKGKTGSCYQIQIADWGRYLAESKVEKLPSKNIQIEVEWHVGASYGSLAPTYFICQSALTPLLLLSKQNRLRWASVWGALCAAFFLSVLTVCSKFESHVLANWGWDVVFKFGIPLWYAGNQSCYSGVLLQNIIWILQAKGKDIILESEDMAVACNKERKLITISI